MGLNNKIVWFFFLLLFFPTEARLQDWYLVSFKDKNNNPYSLQKPEVFLSEASILRRQKFQIPLDSTDLPVNGNYIQQIQQLGFVTSNSSKWLNAVLVKVDTPTQLPSLTQFTFVDSVAYMAPLVSSGKKLSHATVQPRYKSVQTSGEAWTEGNATLQRDRMIELDMLHSMGYHGNGIHIAVLDNGFKSVSQMTAFAHLFSNHQILDQFNFTDDGIDIYNSATHGTYVLSTMAAYLPNQYLGAATAAFYSLYKTEDARYEYPIEEFNWLCGAERADSVGADIVTSSLMYYEFDKASLNHSKSQLDGKTAIVTRAAGLAFLKGIFVINSAGNEAAKEWHLIGFPADAAEVLTVGGVNDDGMYAPFSSQGPTADNRIKPNVVALASNAPLVSPDGKIILGSGTSFSAPLIAGAMACLLQFAPKYTLNEYSNAIQSNASQSAKPDMLLGYGIPNFYLTALQLKKPDAEIFVQSEKLYAVPNPFNDQFHLHFYEETPSEASVSILNMSGDELWSSSFVCNGGFNAYRISYLNYLSSGIYMVHLKTKGTSRVIKILKL